jgi:hypothetical protein
MMVILPDRQYDRFRARRKLSCLPGRRLERSWKWVRSRSGGSAHEVCDGLGRPSRSSPCVTGPRSSPTSSSSSATASLRRRIKRRGLAARGNTAASQVAGWSAPDARTSRLNEIDAGGFRSLDDGQRVDFEVGRPGRQGTPGDWRARHLTRPLDTSPLPHPAAGFCRPGPVPATCRRFAARHADHPSRRDRLVIEIGCRMTTFVPEVPQMITDSTSSFIKAPNAEMSSTGHPGSARPADPAQHRRPRGSIRSRWRPAVRGPTVTLTARAAEEVVVADGYARYPYTSVRPPTAGETADSPGGFIGLVSTPGSGASLTLVPADRRIFQPPSGPGAAASGCTALRRVGEHNGHRRRLLERSGDKSGRGCAVGRHVAAVDQPTAGARVSRLNHRLLPLCKPGVLFAWGVSAGQAPIAFAGVAQW